MNFLPAICALCGAACNDHVLISSEGPPTYGDHDVALCDACCARYPTCEEIWELFAKKNASGQLNLFEDKP